MILAFPFLLLGLLVLPLLWWLLRALPPAPRVQPFPAIRLLEVVHARTQEPRKAPPWLLVLRIAATALLVLGLAQPVLVQDRSTAPGSGTLLLAIDNGWASAPEWSARIQAARETLDRAGRAGRPVRLLMTAPDGSGAAPQAGPALAASILRSRLDSIQPMPWPVDRAAAASSLRDMRDIGSVTYLSDGLATFADNDFATALHAAGPVSELRAEPAMLALPDRPVPAPGRLVARIKILGAPVPRVVAVQGETASGSVLARLNVPVPAGETQAEASMILPAELRNQVSRLVLAGMPGAGGVRLLDEGDRRRPVGLVATGGADTPLLGALFFLRRALASAAELREGPVDQLLSRQLSVLIAPDGTLDGPAAQARVATWVRQGGTLIRFAGPQLAARAAEPGTTDAQDPLLPVALLGGARQLGGAMSWGHPEHPAPFPDDSPFAGLAIPAEVTVSRQVLAEPSADLGQRSWARLADGTPLVTHTSLGDGQLVLFHVTGTADWSNLPLSGLFPEMLQRLVQRAAGLSSPGDRTLLAPALTLSADGQLGVPPAGAQSLAADRFGSTPASALHPAGLYGPVASRRSLNLADALPPLVAEAPVGQLRSLADQVPDRPLGPILLVLALALLVIDVIATLLLRGLLRGWSGSRMRRVGRIAVLLPVLWAAASFLPGASAGAVETGPVPGAALETRLAYVITGDATVDDISREGLEGLTAYANARTSAQLGHPDGVLPGRDDLAFYPMLYWPVTPATAPAVPTSGWTASLNTYMSHGGILLIDTQGSDSATTKSSGDGFTLLVPGSGNALRRATAGLDIPSLRPVDSAHVLSRSFYLLHAYPGRYAGAPVWVAGEDDLGNDGVSPVIIGANDWAGAWAVDPAGQNPYAVIPGAESQRVTAYRFGVNAVIYALTGNYKTDQVHVPALLQRLGQ